MMQAYFHLENAHEREDELNRKLELARLRADRGARPQDKPPLRHVLTHSFRRTAHRALALHGK
jgi:hypothetical protein